MADLEDLRRRMTALEDRVSGEARLRASVDHDLSEVVQSVRAQHHLVQALAITQSIHTTKLEEHTEVLRRLFELAVQADDRLNGLEETAGRLEAKVDRILEALGGAGS